MFISQSGWYYTVVKIITYIILPLGSINKCNTCNNTEKIYFIKDNRYLLKFYQISPCHSLVEHDESGWEILYVCTIK